MPIYELINPSDPYSFEAPNLKIAAAAVVMLSPAFGARRCGDDVEECTPILFGWEDWLSEHGIDESWVAQHRAEIADALDSFLIGDYTRRQDVVDMLDMLSPDKREEWRARRQDRHRSSLNQIGKTAYEYARRIRRALTPA